MNIIIISIFSNELTSKSNNRFNYILESLSERGHNVTLVSSDFNHNEKNRNVSIPSDLKYSVILLKELSYKKNVSVKRLLAHFFWSKKIKRFLKNIPKPDVIYCAVPSFLSAKYAGEYCNQNNIRFCIDIQDLWPEAFEMVFRVPVLSNIIFYPFRCIANKVYSLADDIIAVSKTYACRAMQFNHKTTICHPVFLGTKIDEFINNKDCPINKNSTDIWMTYIGTLGHSYDLRIIFDALFILKKLNKCGNLRFMIMGDGPLKNYFKKYAMERSLNVTFTGRLPYKEMVSVLCNCDFAVNPIMHGAAQSIINKVGDYAAAGLPVLNTQECPEYRNLIDKYEMGINCDNTDVNAISSAIDLLYRDENMRKKQSENAKKCFCNCFDRTNTYNEIFNLFE